MSYIIEEFKHKNDEDAWVYLGVTDELISYETVSDDPIIEQ